jgi:hypothetical protein
MYLDEIAGVIRSHIPDNRMPDGDADQLLRLYAILLRAKGTTITESDVHDAWSAWMSPRNNNHLSLVAYEDLPKDVQTEDRIFATAIRRAAEDLGRQTPSRSSFGEILFPSGPPQSDAESSQALELYKVMVQSSESLVGRRQAVNTFFLTMNGALLTAIGIIVQSSRDNRLGSLGVAVLALTGAILCAAWRSLINSFGQLNYGKFQVINSVERFLAVAIYAAEWEALGRGQDPKIYRSFTSREIWVPNALLALHIGTALVAIIAALGWLSLNP